MTLQCSSYLVSFFVSFLVFEFLEFPGFLEAITI